MKIAEPGHTVRWGAALVAMLAGALVVGAEPGGIRMRVTNPLPVARSAETLVIAAASLHRHGIPAKTTALSLHETGGASLDCQPVDTDGNGSVDEWVFQVDLGPSQTRQFVLAPAATARTSTDARVGGRLVPERKDDFAWENDRIAFRLYGRRVEDELISSGVDVWCKRTPALVIDGWYARNDYHRDHGEGLDAYTVGPGRGCGGTAAWVGERLIGARNFVASRVLARGPIRFMFEVFYEPWLADGRHIVEIKRVTLDAGSQLNRFESRFIVAPDPAGIRLAAGLARRPGNLARVDAEAGWLRVWEPLANKTAGDVGLGLVWADQDQVKPDVRELPDHLLAVVPAGAATKWTYYAGAAWPKAGDYPSVEAWDAYLAAFAHRLRSPVQIEVLATP